MTVCCWNKLNQFKVLQKVACLLFAQRCHEIDGFALLQWSTSGRNMWKRRGEKMHSRSKSFKSFKLLGWKMHSVCLLDVFWSSRTHRTDFKLVALSKSETIPAQGLQFYMLVVKVLLEHNSSAYVVVLLKWAMHPYVPSTIFAATGVEGVCGRLSAARINLFMTQHKTRIKTRCKSCRVRLPQPQVCTLSAWPIVGRCIILSGLLIWNPFLFPPPNFTHVFNLIAFHVFTRATSIPF